MTLHEMMNQDISFVSLTVGLALFWLVVGLLVQIAEHFGGGDRG